MQKMFTISSGGALAQSFMQSTLPFTLGSYAIFLVFCWLNKTESKVLRLPALSWVSRQWHSSTSLRLATCACLAFVILGFAPEDVAPFIYFQF
jgi:hypothetical protein